MIYDIIVLIIIGKLEKIAGKLLGPSVVLNKDMYLGKVFI